MKLRVIKPLMMLAVLLLAVGLGWGILSGRSRIRTDPVSVHQFHAREFQVALRSINRGFSRWSQELGVSATPKADNLAIARRISLGLVGCGLSLEEIRALDSIPQEQQIAWWTNYLLEDRRWANYFAERFSKAMVGSDNGPFLLFRRGRFNAWLSDQFYAGVGYDEIVRRILASEGLWTDTPQVNFITASMTEGNGRKCDPVVLTGRMSRTFLAQRIDCLQCHDDFLAQHDFGLSGASIPGQQLHFHQLAAFFSGTALPENPFSGIRELGDRYRTTLNGSSEEVEVAPAVPYLSELLPSTGKPRQRLAAWVTHPENLAFRRATVNRVWAFMFSRPLVDPVDSLPLDDSIPEPLDRLAEYFVEAGCDLRQLVRIIISSDAFQRSSRADFAITQQHETCYAAFPITQLLPEQVAASIVQASKLTTVNSDSSIITRLASFGDRRDFLRDFGNRHDDEFEDQAITIAQRLVMMNGKLVAERTKPDIVANAATRIAQLVRDDKAAIELVFLTVLSRYPSEREQQRMVECINQSSGDRRVQVISDLYWALLNSTEFSWNH